MARHLPLVLVSQKAATTYMSPAVRAAVDTVFVGCYDENRHPKTNRHYTPAFLNGVTIIKKKTK